jgi:glycosyltransferase involved in cell wall biosynthesis
MKVAMIDPSAFTPPYDHHLCDGLSEAGCDATLVTTDFDYVGWENETSYEKSELFYDITNRLYSSMDSSWHRKVLKGGEHIVDSILLIRYLERLDPDVIHVQWLPLPAVDQFFVERLKHIAPVVYTVHDTTPYHGATPSRLQVWGIQSVPEKFNRLIVHTDEAKEELTERGIAAAKISVVPHGVLRYPGNERSPSEPSSSSTSNENVVLFFGGIKDYKGIDILLRAFSELHTETRERTTLKIAGSSSTSVDDLQELATELGIENRIDWDIRYIPDEIVPQLFETADVVVFPYRNADQSGALMTALPYGKPIIASDVGGFADVLEEGTHGHLVEPNDHSALSEALEDVLTAESKRNRMGEEVRNLATNTYSWQEIAHQTIEIYDNLTAEASAGQ